jgi:hypothetical protein
MVDEIMDLFKKEKVIVVECMLEFIWSYVPEFFIIKGFILPSVCRLNVFNFLFWNKIIIILTTQLFYWFIKNERNNQ